MKNFTEYLDSKNVIAKPKVKAVADEVDMPKDRCKKPPQGYGMTNGQQPYVPDSGGKPKMGKKGFGDEKSKNVPCYDVSQDRKPAKIPTAESPFDIAPIVRESLKADPRTAEAIVWDLKKNGLLGSLVGELLTHKETYLELAGVMNSKKYGQSVCDRLARAIREISVPFSDEHDDGEELEDELDHEEEEPDEDLDDDEEEVPDLEHPDVDHEIEMPMDDPDHPELSDEEPVEDDEMLPRHGHNKAFEHLRRSMRLV